MLQRSKGALGSAVEGGVLLLNARSGQYHELNPVASRIWDLLDQPTDEDTIVATLLAEYDVSPADCREEVTAFLKLLDQRGLLTAG
ncbi:MAG: HPr-rel-A system PqqD family peptide chaperone [Alphaproteobacteria bacterium]|nr:HPr-rel-A system PqqD family peptide chaperone [Alphaproteobacteria bacterium]MBU1525974.1 HPr-rel-A system PqqD family peptide chaperone [Alphaproteobacteria bacterium]MBU2118371.1 HPr-rel-A system PqqD family peptide chaperone [Alphaproteobacteria bacterium]MBU2350382.1 HPr-rel-A system PqqD family peptide chaperone [Alphaproteobacteria bacterium]MBU2381616.1 HPr-rel-A system PqqD family peptide chaperone [Alphaproteobacteria bacterium]